MYSSNSSLNGNNNNLTGTSFCSSTPFTFESNSSSSTSKHHQNTCFPPSPFSFIQFPYDTFEDNNQIFLLQEQDDHIQMNVKNKEEEEEEDKGKTVVVVDEHKKNVQRKRSSKRDRHSKIKTAKGLRDRRMRLSLDVAKKFFGLQDMLGFEKASKTVEWLLNKSKLEIKQLAREKNLQNDSSSTTSECEEGVSSLDNNDHQQQQQKIMLVKRSSSTNKVSRKSAFNCIGREKARERARERTRQKLNARIRDVNIVDQSNSKQCVNNNTNNNNWNPFEECAVNNSSFDVKMINHEAKEHSELEDEENSLFINMTKWSPTFMFNNSSILQQHQYAQFQCLEKPWEDYNNTI